MAKPENSFITGVHRYLRCYHMKNHNEYVGGIADCWYSGEKRDLWIEYKYVRLPKRDTTMIVPELSPLQLLWLNDRRSEGRNIRVVIGCQEGAVMLSDPLEWETGLSAAWFRKRVLTRAQLANDIDTFVSN